MATCHILLSAEKKAPPIYLQIITLAIGRMVMNSAMRMVYPFLPAFSRGLNITTAEMAGLVSLRPLASLSSPFFGPLSERYGRRPVLAGAVIVFGVVLLLVPLFPYATYVGIVMISLGLAKVIFDAAMQAHIGDVVPYAQRGRAIGLVEFSWAGGLLIGAPFVGWLMRRSGWTSPFIVLGVLAIVAGILLIKIMPGGKPKQSKAGSWAEIIPMVRRNPVVLAAAAHVFGLMIGSEIISIVYADWMETTFDLNLSALGISAVVIGGAEVAGEGIVATLIDRIGKKRLVLIAGLGASITYALLPNFAVNLTGAFAGLFIVFFFFETAIVGNISINTGLVPEARAVVMSLMAAASALARFSGAWIGPQLWQWGGWTANAVASATFSLAGVAIFYWFVQEGEV